MAPKLPTSEIDAASFHNSFENSGNQITTSLQNPGMINKFLELYRQESLTGEKCKEFQEQVSEFERKYQISFSLLVKVKQTVPCCTNPFSVQNPLPGLNPFIFMDLVDLIRQAEIIHNVQVRPGNGKENETRSEISQPPPTVTYNNIVVDVPAAVTHVQDSATLNRQHIPPSPTLESSEALLQLENGTENNVNRRRCRRRESKKFLRLGKTFFPLTVQAGLSVLTSVIDAGGLSSTAEAKQLLNIAALSNMVGYIGCLADILLRHHSKRKAANVMGRIGSTAAVFGFLTMMGTVLGLKPVVMIGVAAAVTVVFILAAIKH
ncbi:hypothetical protein OWV82_007023 [Melia azedarach]|uniref:Uncharacterized protein n=1 Tax=Melia azedarach TaxID=155640 RepID=A0ACC1YIP9_MELAZ|nr:hypothetical protein OWV82_007023 [Melia azedarach]